MVIPPRLRFDNRGVAVPDPGSNPDPGPMTDAHNSIILPLPDASTPRTGSSRFPIGPPGVRRRRRRSPRRRQTRHPRRPSPRYRTRPPRRRVRLRCRVRDLVRWTAVLLIGFGTGLATVTPDGPARVNAELVARLLNRIATAATPW
ncbi:hypothetical protein [Frankia sp. Cas4]|uniref:hypothetical protein n=1 Tax=Frankia sp. Cas4 TaxID=3073927 RepID=UPI002AD4B6CA|nr:hypothetical protein [Frankia sp. Cas4]